MNRDEAEGWIENNAESFFSRIKNLLYFATKEENGKYKILIGVKHNEIADIIALQGLSNSNNMYVVAYEQAFEEDPETKSEIKDFLSKQEEKIQKDDSINIVETIPVFSEEDVYLQTDYCLLTERNEFMNGGTSISLIDDDDRSGTAGAFFTLENQDDIFMISNHHVLGAKEIGKRVVFPSLDDANCNKLPIKSHEIGSSFWSHYDDYMDVAIVKMDEGVKRNNYTRCESIDMSAGIEEAVQGQKVFKCGRTTGLRKGEIISTFCYVKITFTKQRKYKIFKDQIMTTCMSKKGDSGSVLVNDKKEVVGLLFAGSKKKSFYNPINRVIDKFRKECFPENDFNQFV